jgi:endonuclease III
LTACRRAISKRLATVDSVVVTRHYIGRQKSKIEKNRFIETFANNKLHRFNNDMAEVFYEAIQHIKTKYDNDASKIWKDKPSSALVVYRFLEFKGCGVKIATMAANILARQYKIEFSDYYSIDISPDTHIMRVMKRMGYISNDSNREMVIYKARELYPEFPGIIDFSCWEIGRGFCKPKNPDCENCLVKSQCKKII